MPLADLADPRIARIAIANPKHAPYGKRAVEALKAAGVWAQVEPKLVYGENIAQTAQFVQTGNAQVGIIALSLALNPELARRGGYDALLADVDDRRRWPSPDAVADAMQAYWDEFDEILTGADARSGAMFAFDRASGRATQTLADPLDGNEWRIVATVDIAASADEGRAVVRLVEIGPAL